MSDKFFLGGGDIHDYLKICLKRLIEEKGFPFDMRLLYQEADSFDMRMGQRESVNIAVLNKDSGAENVNVPEGGKKIYYAEIDSRVVKLAMPSTIHRPIKSWII